MSDGLELRPDQMPQRPPQEGVVLENVEESSLEQDEQAIEQSAEYVDDVLHAEGRSGERAGLAVTSTSTQVAEPMIEKDELVIEVEKILEDGVGAFYDSLPPEAKPIFRARGEAVAREIAEMVRTLKIHVKRIVILITDWLKSIPGVNKYFLEQEAKIKADRIVQLIEAKREERHKQV